MGLKNATPPPRPANDRAKQAQAKPKPKRKPVRFENIAESDNVQFNRRVPQGTADGYEILAIKLRRKVPDLLTEGLELLEEKYGKV